ncbi:GntR family transcriptional regulator [Paraburkholderia oxyphila]|uniref:GntR family transcriptional regulator n=1 Tax=Paraburkholderia oxyphila TaxID=614212 RepID=UPI0007C455A5|nr:GntR family transcriptional regulator [Paraburkholderia oxyphila]
MATKTPVDSASQEPKQNIRERVYHYVRNQIRKGEVSFEHKLVDHEIAALLGVSRMPVREALLQMKSEGLLEGTARGFILRRFTPTDIANIFETRLLLEPTAASEACRHTTLEGLGRMRSAISAAEQAYASDDAARFIEASEAFRTAWIGMVPNPHLVQTIDRLRDHVEAVRLATLRDREVQKAALENNRAILEAFMHADAEAAKAKTTASLRLAATFYYTTQEAIIGGSLEDTTGQALSRTSAARKEARPVKG